jgi:DNA-binding IclR family transcriptional regulator
MPGLADERADAGTQSIRRAIGVLRILAMARDTGYGLTEVARLTGLTRPTAHRILLALIDEGLVEQKPQTRRYAVGEQIQLLALSRPRRSPLIAAAEPVLDQVATEIGDTIFLTQRAGLDTVCVARRLGSYPVQVLSLSVGDRRPLGVSSSGLALLARLPEDEAEGLLVQNAPRLGSYGTSLAQATEWVRQTRRLGFAVRDRGLVPGTRAISVVIRDRDGQAFAAITCAGVVRRMSQSRMDAIAEELHLAAGLIETALAAPR